MLFDYSKITAPFAGVVTQRFANLGTLMQAGTSSSTQAMPLVRLSEDDKFRLVIPVPESYVRYIHIGDPVGRHVPVAQPDLSREGGALLRGRAGRHAHHAHRSGCAESERVLLPGLYAEATIPLENKHGALAVPLQAVDHDGDQAIVDVVMRIQHIEIRPVALGIQTATDAEVLSGLNGGRFGGCQRSQRPESRPDGPTQSDRLDAIPGAEPH